MASQFAGLGVSPAQSILAVVPVRRSVHAGYAGLDNELFYMDKTMMVFGDAKRVVEDMLKAIE
ncbi:NAD(P)(+) transhydrogenase (Re/Si-specific) subunit beta [Cupriavidus necator]